MSNMYQILMILHILGIGSIIFIDASSSPSRGVSSHFIPPEIPYSGPRLRRQYYGGPYNQYQYQPYNDRYYVTPILPPSRPSASARSLASYLASSSFSEEDDFVYCPPNNPRKNKVLGLKIFQEVLGNKIITNLDRYFLPSYIQHNPAIADGLEAFRKAVSPGGLLFGPKEQIDFQHVGADGDLVWIHARRVRPTDGSVSAHLDLFRFECGKIAEHWDVIQSTDVADPQNDHPFF